MRRSGDQALDQALAFHRAPGYLAAIRRLPLPEDLQTLLRIAAGDAETTLDAAQRTGESPEMLREVTIFYLQQLLFADDGDSYRVLGVNPDASDEQIRLHYRSLVRWLHPDRNSDEWETVFADRVNRAWQDLRTPDRRAAYDEDRPIDDRPNGHDVSGFPPPEIAAMPEPMQGNRTARWLPTLGVVGIGLLAIAALWLLRQPQVMEPQPAAEIALQPAATTARDDWMPAAESLTTGDAAVTATAAPIASQTSAPQIEAKADSPVATQTTPIVAATVAESRLVNADTQGTASSKQPVVPLSSEAPVPSSKPLTRSALAGVVNKPIAPKVVMVQATPRRTDVVASTPVPISVPAPEPTRILEPVATARLETVAPQPMQPGRSTSDENATRKLIDDRIAASLTSRFSQAYANGDTERLMQLFTQDAQNGHGDRQAIAEDYRHLFEASARRRIALKNLSWLTVGNGVTIIASFETEVVPRGKTHGEHATGDIRFDLREEDGELRIYRLSHDNHRI